MLKKFRLAFLAVLFIPLAILSLGLEVMAGDPAFSQQIFNVKIDVTPNRMLPIPAKRISADIPIKVISDTDHNIIGLQVGEAKGSVFHYDMTDGTHQDIGMEAAAASSDLYGRNTFKVQLTVPVLGQRDLFFFDGTKLDPEKGGPIVINYVSNPVFGSTNKATITLQKSGDSWVASVPKDSGSNSQMRIKNVTVKSGTFGLGFQGPQYTFLDPNAAIESVLSPQPIADPRQSQNQIKTGESTLKEFANSPQNLGWGVSFNLVTGSAR